MRVISGEYGGRKLRAVPGKNTRPTTDKVKEAVFNMIGPFFDGGKCLDLYAGSGSLAIEAVSRGMDQAVLIDRDALAVKTIKENIVMTKETHKYEVYRNDAKRAIELLKRKGYRFDLIFMDPPYAKQDIEVQIEHILNAGIAKEKAWIVCEIDKKVVLPDTITTIEAIRRENYGISQIVIYEVILESREVNE